LLGSDSEWWAVVVEDRKRKRVENEIGKGKTNSDI